MASHDRGGRKGSACEGDDEQETAQADNGDRHDGTPQDGAVSSAHEWPHPFGTEEESLSAPPKSLRSIVLKNCGKSPTANQLLPAQVGNFFRRTRYMTATTRQNCLVLAQVCKRGTKKRRSARDRRRRERSHGD